MIFQTTQPGGRNVEIKPSTPIKCPPYSAGNSILNPYGLQAEAKHSLGHQLPKLVPDYVRHSLLASPDFENSCSFLNLLWGAYNVQCYECAFILIYRGVCQHEIQNQKAFLFQNSARQLQMFQIQLYFRETGQKYHNVNNIQEADQLSIVMAEITSPDIRTQLTT